MDRQAGPSARAVRWRDCRVVMEGVGDSSSRTRRCRSPRTPETTPPLSKKMNPCHLRSLVHEDVARGDAGRGAPDRQGQLVLLAPYDAVWAGRPRQRRGHQAHQLSRVLAAGTGFEVYYDGVTDGLQLPQQRLEPQHILARAGPAQLRQLLPAIIARLASGRGRSGASSFPVTGNGQASSRRAGSPSTQEGRPFQHSGGQTLPAPGQAGRGARQRSSGSRPSPARHKRPKASCHPGTVTPPPLALLACLHARHPSQRGELPGMQHHQLAVSGSCHVHLATTCEHRVG